MVQSRIGQSEHRVSEWEWFTLQLRLDQLGYPAGALYSVSYDWDPDSRLPLSCSIHLSEDNDLEGSDVYLELAEQERATIEQMLASLPELKRELDLDRDVHFQILRSYGQGSSVLALIIGGKLIDG